MTSPACGITTQCANYERMQMRNEHDSLGVENIIPDETRTKHMEDALCVGCR